jgi:hypothetical protein
MPGVEPRLELWEVEDFDVLATFNVAVSTRIEERSAQVRSGARPLTYLSTKWGRSAPVYPSAE